MKTTKPIEHYLCEYATWLSKNHPGPRWMLKEALRVNLNRWEQEYGESVAKAARSHIVELWRKLKREE